MKDMKKYRYFRILTAALLLTGAAVTACQLDEGDNVPLIELGALQKEYVAPFSGMTVEMPVLANGGFHIVKLDEDADWITFSTMEGSEDMTIDVNFAYNEEFKRMARIALCSDNGTRRDTIALKQEGQLEAILSIDNTSVITEGHGGAHSETIRTNVPFSYMTVKKTFPSGEEETWLKDITIEDGTDLNRSLIITTEANPDQINPRTAAVEISFTDGWGDKVGMLLNLVQRNAKEGIGRAVSFEEVVASYTTGKPIDDYILLDGIVVSNPAGGNSGENEQLTTSTIDYTGSKRSVYLEAADGSRGVMLVTKSESDNVFNQFDHVQILLKDLTAVLQDNPERVTIKGLASSNIISRVAGTKADVPVKEKFMNELTDRDVFTYVTLKDVEFPVRKGALCAINEGYSIGTGAHRISKYPRLIRDINGNSMYLYTNTVCTYRNDGTRLPYGSGKISGVIVHERFSRFEWRDGADPLEMEDDETLGNIGRYQIRHQTKGDVWDQMKDSVEDSFSALLTEYRWWFPDKENEVCRPTYGENGWFTHTYQMKYTGSEALQYTQATYKQHMWGAGNYTYLGPCGNQAAPDWYKAIYDPENHYGNLNGIGMVIDTAKEHFDTSDKALSELLSYNPDGTLEWCGPNAKSTTAVGDNGINYNGSTSMRGKSNAYGGTFNGWASHFWWDYDTGRPYAWMINFSTAGITTNHISLQIDVMNTQQTWYSPRFWKAEWSFVDSMDPKDDKEWHLLKEYTIPDVSVWANTLFSSIVGYKTIDIPLPLEILGHENVYIRLCPTSDVCSDGSDYANAILSGNPTEAAHASAIDYIAIRYNK